MNRALVDAFVLVGVWILLLATAPLSAVWGRELATLVSFGGAALLVLATRPAVSNPSSALRRVTALGLGVAAGYASFAAWTLLIVEVGLVVGLEPRMQRPTAAAGVAPLVAAVLFAPLFEELLYRERLLVLIRKWIGPLGAVVATACLFALPHLETWALLGTFLVGLGLGGLRLATGSVAPCVGVHAGLNLAAALSS